jgi:hypothetical protein
MKVCALLIAAYFPGFDLQSVDKARVYAIPSSAIAQLTTAQKLAAKACALRYGVHYKII